ncbi:MAG TPA: cytochrome c3 family protein [Myxococcales bacterium]|nr:cytochrome c3 family protein [Myxococcales bacterium]
MIALALLLAVSADAKLLPGAQGKLCLSCHADFQPQLKKQFVHTPVKGQDCTSCHDPHAARHGKLLSKDRSQVCLGCHQGVIPAAAKSTHKPVAEGACVSCHDPHASDDKGLLKKPAAELCASCHQAIADGAARARHKHLEGERSSCTTCHDPHGSQKAQRLLTAEEPALCLQCHKPSAPQFAKAHVGYPVQKARCTTCHDPHGSDQPGMLYADVHKPLLQKQCADCHVAPTSPTPFAIKAAPGPLCKTCHGAQVDRMMNATDVHQAIVDERACLNCHTPHASRQRGLVAGNLVQVCGKCHQDTIARQERSPTQHPPVAEGDCAQCHDMHSSENALLMKKADSSATCSKCHDYTKHQSHPIGAKLKDPRNPSLSLECLSCHRAHGTEFKHLGLYATTTELCTKCHTQYTR